jgi:hypothetical protein
MITPDLLHEFEIGVWKAVFIHLIRILLATNETQIPELDRRYVMDTQKGVKQLIFTPGTEKSLRLVEIQSGASSRQYLS